MTLDLDHPRPQRGERGSRQRCRPQRAQIDNDRALERKADWHLPGVRHERVACLARVSPAIATARPSQPARSISSATRRWSDEPSAEATLAHATASSEATPVTSNHAGTRSKSDGRVSDTAQAPAAVVNSRHEPPALIDPDGGRPTAAARSPRTPRPDEPTDAPTRAPAASRSVAS